MKKSFFSRFSQAGVTITEMLVASTVLTTLAAVSAPNWVNFTNQQRLQQANEQIDTAFRLARGRSRQESQAYSVQLRMNGNIPQMVIFRGSTLPTTPAWSNLIDRPNFLTLSLTQGDRVTFSHDGSIAADSLLRPDEKVTLTLTGNANSPRQCVVVRTLLGSIAQDRANNCLQ
jgi:Tfp pilus assembly protein FimT